MVRQKKARLRPYERRERRRIFEFGNNERQNHEERRHHGECCRHREERRHMQDTKQMPIMEF